MPETLDRSAYLDAVRDAAARIEATARSVELTTEVPTCPRWTVHDLVQHQGGVHRWATAQVTGVPGRQIEARIGEWFTAPAAADDLGDWFADGAVALLGALAEASDDRASGVFLKDPPPPATFWARRQAHETTIHAVDALAASHGRVSTTAEIGVDATLAADGVDELLTGFLPRGGSRLRADAPATIEVRAADVGRCWSVLVSADPPVTTRTAAASPDLTLSGPAAAVYVAVWNRGDDVETTGRADLLDLWRRKVRVRW